MFWSKPFIVVSINISRFINSTLTPSITVIWAWNQHGCVIWQPFQKLSKFTDRKIMVSHSSPCEDRTHLVLLVRQVQSPDCERAIVTVVSGSYTQSLSSRVSLFLSLNGGKFHTLQKLVANSIVWLDYLDNHTNNLMVWTYDYIRGCCSYHRNDK